MKIGDIVKRDSDTFKVVRVYEDGDVEAVRWIKTREAWSKAHQTVFAIHLKN